MYNLIYIKLKCGIDKEEHQESEQQKEKEIQQTNNILPDQQINNLLLDQQTNNLLPNQQTNNPFIDHLLLSVDIPMNLLVYFLPEMPIQTIKKEKMDIDFNKIQKNRRRIYMIEFYIQKIKLYLYEEPDKKKQDILIQMIDNLKYKLSEIENIFQKNRILAENLIKMITIPQICFNEEPVHNSSQITKALLKITSASINKLTTLINEKSINNNEMQNNQIEENEKLKQIKQNNIHIMAEIHSLENHLLEISDKELDDLMNIKPFKLIQNIYAEKIQTIKKNREKIYKIAQSLRDLYEQHVNIVNNAQIIDQYVENLYNKIQQNTYHIQYILYDTYEKIYEIINSKKDFYISKILVQYAEYIKEKRDNSIIPEYYLQLNGKLSKTKSIIIEQTEKMKKLNNNTSQKKIERINNYIELYFLDLQEQRRFIKNEILSSYRVFRYLTNNSIMNMVERFESCCFKIDTCSEYLSQFGKFMSIYLLNISLAFRQFLACLNFFQKIESKIKDIKIYEKHQKTQKEISNYLKTNLNNLLYLAEKTPEMLDSLNRYYKKQNHLDSYKQIKEYLINISKDTANDYLIPENNYNTPNKIDYFLEPEANDIFTTNILNPICKTILEEIKLIDVNTQEQPINRGKTIFSKILFLNTEELQESKKILEKNKKNYLIESTNYTLFYFFQVANILNKVYKNYDIDINKLNQFLYNIINVIEEKNAFMPICIKNDKNVSYRINRFNVILNEFINSINALLTHHRVNELIIYYLSIVTIFGQYFDNKLTRITEVLNFLKYKNTILNQLIKIYNNNVGLCQQIVQHINNLYSEDIVLQNEDIQELDKLKTTLMNTNIPEKIIKEVKTTQEQYDKNKDDLVFLNIPYCYY